MIFPVTVAQMQALFGELSLITATSDPDEAAFAMQRAIDQMQTQLATAIMARLIGDDRFDASTPVADRLELLENPEVFATAGAYMAAELALDASSLRALFGWDSATAAQTFAAQRKMLAERRSEALDYALSLAVYTGIGTGSQAGMPKVADMPAAVEDFRSTAFWTFPGY